MDKKMGQRITEETFTFPLFFKLVNEEIQSKKIENNTYFRFTCRIFCRISSLTRTGIKKRQRILSFCAFFLGRYPGGCNAELFFQSLHKCIEN